MTPQPRRGVNRIVANGATPLYIVASGTEHTLASLTEYLREKELSFAEFAAITGVSAAHLNRIARGERNASVAVMKKIKAATKGKVRFEDMVR